MQVSYQGDADMVGKLEGYVAEIRTLLEETEKNTDGLAWKIRDKPVFRLSEQAEGYLNEILTDASGQP